MSRKFVWLILAAWLASISSTCFADPQHQPDMACLERVARELPGPVKPASIWATPIQGKRLRGKRLLFRQGKVILALDFDGFRSSLGKGDTKRFPELLNAFQLLETVDEVQVADARDATYLHRHRLDHWIANVIEKGLFEIRHPSPANTDNILLRLDWSYYCGDLCSGKGRVFITEKCEKLASVVDMQS